MMFSYSMIYFTLLYVACNDCPDCEWDFVSESSQDKQNTPEIEHEIPEDREELETYIQLPQKL